MRQFKDFIVGNEFNIETYPQSPSGFYPPAGDVPYLSQVSRDNGVNRFISETSLLKLNKGHVLVTGVDNIANGVMYYQKDSFYANKMIGIRHEKMTESSALYIATKLKKFYSGYDYNNKISLGIIEMTSIELPVNSDNEPDWDYMDSYIESMKLKFIDKIKVEGEELVEKIHPLLDINVPYVLEDVEFGKFQVSDIFKTIERGRRIRSSDRISGDIPFVTAGDIGFGISSEITIEDNLVIRTPSITIDMFASGYVRDYDFYCDDHVTYLTDAVFDGVNPLFYICGKLNKMFAGQFTYSRNFYPKHARVEISLPVDSAGNPNWDYMDKYISNMKLKVVNKLISDNYALIGKLKELK